MPFRSIVRLGSITEIGDEVSRGGKRIECNTVNAVTNSMDKLLMKQCFNRGNVKTAAWETGPIESLELPIVAKNRFGSRGRGNHLLTTEDELNSFITSNSNRLSNYIFEKFYNYSREYRLHVTSDGCFYACRKMLKDETPDNQRWYRNDSNCVWIVEDNPMFDKPSNWEEIERHCVMALSSVGLDVGACDVKVQRSTTSKGKQRSAPDFIVIEINSAPSFGDLTLSHYLKIIPTILRTKYEEATKK